MSVFLTLRMSHLLESISKHTIAKRIKHLESIDLINISYDELEKFLNEMMQGYSFFTRWAKLNPCYRARKNIGAQHFTNVSELTYPPAKFIKVPGRINRVGESIFYIASDESTALAEVRASVGDIITVCEIETLKEGFNLSEMGMPEYFSHAGASLLENTTAGINHFGPDKRTGEKNIMIRNFFITQFVKIVNTGFEHEYKITNSISTVLSNDDNYEGLMYPSIATSHKGINVAVKPTVADKYFKFRRLWFERIDVLLPSSQFEVTRLAHSIGITDAGEIEWSYSIDKYL
jgi:hypothetical protein